jgi:hypothetical protein
MADDLSIQAAKSMMQMMASRTSTEIGVKLMKMQAQQDQGIATMLATLAASGPAAAYTPNGGSISPAALGSVDTTM